MSEDQKKYYLTVLDVTSKLIIGIVGILFTIYTGCNNTKVANSTLKENKRKAAYEAELKLLDFFKGDLQNLRDTPDLHIQALLHEYMKADSIFLNDSNFCSPISIYYSAFRQKNNEIKKEVVRDSTNASISIKDTVSAVTSSYEKKYPKLGNKSLDDFPTIFIQCNNSDLRDDIDIIKAELSKQYLVPPMEYLNMDFKNSIRYYQDADKPIAENLMRQLKTSGFDCAVLKVKSSSKNTFEIWLSKRDNSTKSLSSSK